MIQEVAEDEHGGHIVSDEKGRLHATSGDSERRVREYERKEKAEGRKEAAVRALKAAAEVFSDSIITATNFDYGADSLNQAKANVATGHPILAGINAASAGMEAAYDAELASAKKFVDGAAAVIELAKTALRRGVSLKDALTLLDWADEYSVPSHGPESHPNRNFREPHIHIGPVDHIQIK